MSDLTSTSALNQTAFRDHSVIASAVAGETPDKIQTAACRQIGKGPDSRLYQDASGRLQVAPKSVGYVVGERLIRPMLDSISYIWSRLPSLSLPTASAAKLPMEYTAPDLPRPSKLVRDRKLEQQQKGPSCHCGYQTSSALSMEFFATISEEKWM